MKSQILIAFIAFAILGVFIVYADLSPSISNDVTRSSNTTQLTLTASGISNLTGISIPDVQDFLGNNIHFTISPTNFPYSLNNSQSATFNITATNFPQEDDSNLGDLSGVINVVSNGGTQTVALPITLGWCNEGDRGNVSIDSIKDTSSSTDWKWQPLDKVDIDVKVRNNDRNNDLDITILMDLYDTVDHQFLGLDGNGGDIEDTLTIDSRSIETFSETVTVPIEALKDSSRYVLYVKAIEDGNEEEQCMQKTQAVNINRETEKIAITNIKSQDIISCGDTATVSLDVANIGNKDEKKVKVVLRNSDFGLSQTKEISNLAKDSNAKSISFSFQIPQNATEKDYTLSFDTSYKYDSNSGDYGISDDSAASASIKVAGNCQAATTIASSDVTLSTSLQSAANAGQELTIKTTLTNTGSSQSTYTLQVSGQDSWSSGLRLSQSQVTLNAGQSQDVLIYLTPNKAVSGDQQLTLTASFNGQTKTQNVVVNVTKAAGFNFNLGNNWYLWLIIGINVILIIVIIIVAVAMSRK